MIRSRRRKEQSVNMSTAKLRRAAVWFVAALASAAFIHAAERKPNLLFMVKQSEHPTKT